MNETLRLFDQFERTDTIPARRTEPIFHALNRLAWKNADRIRELLEGWFVTYPVPHKKALQSRFRSQSDSHHQGAFFELILFQFLTRLGHTVTANPQTPQGTTPDFFAASPYGEKFYVEATVVEPRTLQDSPNEKQAFDGLNELNCPDFWLHVQTHGKLRRTFPLGKRSQIQAWIDGLDYESVQAARASNQQHPLFMVSHDGWTLTLEAIPRGEDHRGKAGGRPLGFGPERGGFIDSAKSLRDAMHKKASKYKAQNLGAPFIVVLNALDLAGVDRIDMLLALFGWEASTYEPDLARIAPPSGIRRKDWLWDANKNTGISALLLFNELHPATLASASLCLYENPWASLSVPASLRCIPHGIVAGEFIRWYPGQALYSILDLPRDWPGSK